MDARTLFQLESPEHRHRTSGAFQELPQDSGLLTDLQDTVLETVL